MKNSVFFCECEEFPFYAKKSKNTIVIRNVQGKIRQPTVVMLMQHRSLYHLELMSIREINMVQPLSSWLLLQVRYAVKLSNV